MTQYRVGIIGATGMVGQRFITLLKDHPWFKVTCLAASARSAGKKYKEAVGERWAFDWPIPDYAADMTIVDAADIDAVGELVDFCFCAVDMKKDEVRALEENYAKHEIPIISNNSACRGIEDVPMVVPEINADHLAVIETQRKRLGSRYGFIAVKPNCSIQSYVPALTPLLDFEPTQVSVCTYQAISGAGKTFKSWPEMVDNVIPYIGGEDEKSENEPLKLWGTVEDKGNGPVIVNAAEPVISAQCLRVACSDGHMAAVHAAEAVDAAFSLRAGAVAQPQDLQPHAAKLLNRGLHARLIGLHQMRAAEHRVYRPVQPLVDCLDHVEDAGMRAPHLHRQTVRRVQRQADLVAEVVGLHALGRLPHEPLRDRLKGVRARKVRHQPRTRRQFRHVGADVV